MLNPGRHMLLFLVSSLGSLTAFAENSNTSQPKPASAPHSTVTKATRKTLEFETQKHSAEIDLLIEKSSFSDGSSVNRLAGLWYKKGEFYVEVVVVDDFQLPTQELKTPTDKLETRSIDSLKGSRSISLKSTSLFFDADETLESGLPESARNECQSEDRLGLARIAEPSVKRTPLVPQESTADENYFKLANLVCLSIL